MLDELRRIEAGQGVNDELLDTIQMIATIMNGMQEDLPMIDEKKKMTAQAHLLAQMMGSQSLKIPRPLYQTRTKKAIPQKEIWRNFTERCAA